MTTTDSKQWLRPEEVEREFGISRHTLAYWRVKAHRGDEDECGPPFYRAGARSIRYRREEVEAWLNARRVF